MIATRMMSSTVNDTLDHGAIICIAAFFLGKISVIREPSILKQPPLRTLVAEDSAITIFLWISRSLEFLPGPRGPESPRPPSLAPHLSRAARPHRKPKHIPAPESPAAKASPTPCPCARSARDTAT